MQLGLQLAPQMRRAFWTTLLTGTAFDFAASSALFGIQLMQDCAAMVSHSRAPSVF